MIKLISAKQCLLSKAMLFSKNSVTCSKLGSMGVLAIDQVFSTFKTAKK